MKSEKSKQTQYKIKTSQPIKYCKVYSVEKIDAGIEQNCFQRIICNTCNSGEELPGVSGQTWNCPKIQSSDKSHCCIDGEGSTSESFLPLLIILAATVAVASWYSGRIFSPSNIFPGPSYFLLAKSLRF